MAGKRVPFVTADNEFGTVNEDEADALPAGSRVLSRAEAADHDLQQQYAGRSTGEKVAGALAGQGIGPKSEAFLQKGRETFGLGVQQAVARKVVDAVKPGAGQDYANHLQQLETGEPTASTAGAVAGLAGQAAVSLAGGAGAAGGAARLLPASGIEALGGLGEGLATKGLGALGVTGESVAGRALQSAVTLGARGAAEGGAYGGVSEATRQALQDPEMSADKIFAATGTGAILGGAGGAILGGAGSLAKSGLGGLAGKGAGMLAREAEEPAIDALTGESALASDSASTSHGTASHSIGNMWSDLQSVEGQKGLAYDQAWKAIGAGHGMQTTRYAGQAAKYLPNGTRDVGEVLMRRGIINPEEGIWNAAKSGTPAALLPKIEEQVETVGQRIGDLTSASPARISGATIEDAVQSVIGKYEKQAGRAHVANATRSYRDELMSVLGVASRDDQVSLQDLLTQRKVLDNIVYDEAKTLDPKGRVAALREVRANLENVIVNAMDDASGQVPGIAKQEYKSLKKDYLALSIAKDAAEDSATRMSKNRTISPTDYLTGAAAAASGHFLAAPVVAVGHKLVRERGNAAAAVAIYNAAHSGQLSSIVAKFDNKLNAAANGLLTIPKKGPLPFSPVDRPRVHAAAMMKEIAALQSDPQGTTDAIAHKMDPVAATHPEIAQALVSRHVAALTFLASKMPSASERDPLDPHPVPHMNDADAASFSRYAFYTQKPERFFVEMAHGKVTYEGAETAQALCPAAFAELQERTLDAIATHMARGRSIPFQQRLKIGDMLDIAATPAQQPDHAAFLQSNTAVLDSGKNKAPPASKGPAKGLSQRSSALDALEQSGPGRR